MTHPNPTGALPAPRQAANPAQAASSPRTEGSQRGQRCSLTPGAEQALPDKGSALPAGRRRHRGLRAAATRSQAPRTLGRTIPSGKPPDSPRPRLPRHLQRQERAPPCRQCGSGPGRPLGAVVPCASPDAVGRRSRDYSPRQAARPQPGWCNHTLARPGAGASAGCQKDGSARDSSRALARALLSGTEGCSAIRMQWWDLLLLWWHRNTARSVVSIAIKFAGSGHERIERVRVTVPALRHFSCLHPLLACI